MKPFFSRTLEILKIQHWTYMGQKLNNIKKLIETTSGNILKHFFQKTLRLSS